MMKGGAVDEQETAGGGLDLLVLRRGIERRDPELLASLYAEDAEVLIVSPYATPSSPRRLRGRGEIAEYLGDACLWESTHCVADEVVGEERVAFNELHEYPDGTRALAATTLEVRGGEIVRQVSVEAWDG
jgi:hypothetical protein